MNCSKCNAILPDGADFCPKCGVSIKGGRLNAEQLAFYTEWENDLQLSVFCWFLMRVLFTSLFIVSLALLCMIILSTRSTGALEIRWLSILSAIGGISVIISIVASFCSESARKKLEKLQRERLFGEKCE